MDRRHELPSHPMPEPLRLRHHSRRSEVARKVTGCAFLTCPSWSPTPALILTSLGIGRPLVRHLQPTPPVLCSESQIAVPLQPSTRRNDAHRVDRVAARI